MKPAKVILVMVCIKNVVTSAQIILIRQATCRLVMLKARAATAAAEPNTKPSAIPLINTPAHIIIPAISRAAPARLATANINHANA